MKLGIDISQIIYEGTGVARFTDGLVKAILEYDKKNNWHFFFSSLRGNLDPVLEKKINQKGHKLIKRKLPPSTLSFLFNDLHNFSKYPASILYLPTSLDWFITSDWTEPPLNVKKATIVHDLVSLRHPETVDSKILITQKKRLRWVKKESKIIFTDSLATKKDLVEFLNIDSKKICVNYPGVEVKKPSFEQINRTLKKYHLNKTFILTVGKVEPRKNIPRLIEAMKQLNNLPAGRLGETIDLVIVGPKGWQQFNNLTMRQLNNIKFLGLLTDIELYALYKSCLFFIYPSIWEGFGFPVIEAMKLGTPVATASTSSLSEIAKDNAILFDPFNSGDMAKCIGRLINDKKLRNELSKKGLERSKIFTWRTYYQKLMKTFYDYRS